VKRSLFFSFHFLSDQTEGDLWDPCGD